MPVSTQSAGETASTGRGSPRRGIPSLYKQVSETFSSGGLTFSDAILAGLLPSPAVFCTCRFLSASRLSAFLCSMLSCTTFMCLICRFKAATTSSFEGFSLQKFLLWCRFHLRTSARSSSMRIGALSGLRRGGNNPSRVKNGRRNSTLPEVTRNRETRPESHNGKVCVSLVLLSMVLLSCFSPFFSLLFFLVFSCFFSFFSF